MSLLWGFCAYDQHGRARFSSHALRVQTLEKPDESETASRALGVFGYATSGMRADQGRTARPGRPMTSEVYWALLSLVIERPSYGGELRLRYQRIYGELQPISSDSHIYSALDALKSRGLIEAMPADGEDRQPKLRYRATGTGVNAYEEWLVERFVADHRRQELLARQLGIFARSPGTMLRVLGRVEDRCLQDAGQVGGRAGSGSSASPIRVMDELVDELRRLSVGGMLSWLRRARERFEELVSDEE